MDATVLAPIFIGTRKWFLKNRPNEWKAFVQEFPENEREFWMNDDLLQASALPASLYTHTYDVVVKLWNEDTFQEIAGAVALEDMGAFMRFFVKMGTPSFTVKMLPGAYKQYFNTGELKVLKVDSRSAQIELVGAGVYGRGGCCGTQGWTRRVLQHVGAKKLADSQPQCRFRGQTRCLIEFAWE
jgi:hypothetical protein